MENDNVKLLFCGDLAFTESTGKISILDDEMNDVFKKHDLRCVNLECTLQGEKKVKVGPRIVLDESMCSAVKTAGFNLLCLANNHIMDEGLSGLSRIKTEFKEIPMVGAGESEKEAYTPFYYTKENRTIGIINLAENGFGASVNGGVCVVWTPLCA